MKIKIRQQDSTDCGVACLASVAAFHSLQFPVARIRQIAGTDTRGTTLLGLVEAAGLLGFEAKAIRGLSGCLADIPLPAIAHTIVREQLHHYVVIYKVSSRHITIMDPASGTMKKVKYAQFVKEWTGVLLLLTPGEKFTPGNHQISVTQRFLQLAKPHRKTLALVLLGSVIYTVSGLSISLYIQKIADYVLPQSNIPLLNGLGIIMIMILLLQLILYSIKSLLALKLSRQIDLKLMTDYYRHLLHLPQQFFDSMRTGEMISRINDAAKIRALISEISVEGCMSIGTLLLSCIVMFVYHWKLALIVWSVLPLYLLLYYCYNRINKKRLRQIMEDGAALETCLIESLQAAATIKRFGIEISMYKKAANKMRQLTSSVYSAGKTSIYIGAGGEGVAKLFIVVLLWTGSYYVLQQTLTLGELLSFYALTAYFTVPIFKLLTLNEGLQDAWIAADRLFQVMDLPTEETNHKQINLTPSMIGDIHINNLCFRYGTGSNVLEDCNITIRKSSTTAIVGESGSGKSTLLSLLQKTYPVQKGAIYLGGYNLQHIDLISVREQIGIVPQQIDLFTGSIIENIALDDPAIDMYRLTQICMLLGIHEFIQQLPYRYDTCIGENGLLLSVGQRQRIGIARAVYRDPEILLLDEPTASLDSIAEQQVQNLLKHVQAEGKTIIIVAHRLSTIKNADHIIVLQHGKPVEEGTHQQLLTNKGLYYRMYEQQIN